MSKIISDINQQTRQATPPEELRERFMDRSRPATEAEHWARRHIEALEAEIAELREANRIACEDIVVQQNLRVTYAEQIAELVVALKGANDLTEILRMPNIEHVADAHNKAVRSLRAALAKMRKP